MRSRRPPRSTCPVSWHALGRRPRHLRGRGGAVRRRDGPRVLPAFRGSQARVRDRADLRAPRRAVRPRGGRRAAGAPGGAAPGTSAPARRYLLELAVGGLLGNETKERRRRSRSARRRSRSRSPASAFLPAERGRPGQRARRRTAARRSSVRGWTVLERELNPLHRQTLERAHELARELGWPSYREMYEELKQIDLGALEQQTSAFLARRAGRYREPSSRTCARQVGVGFDRAAAIRPAALLPGAGVRRPVPLGADRRGPRADARRARDRPARPVQRAPRHRAAAAQEPARLLRAGVGAGRGVPRDRAPRRPRRLRGAVPRGGPHGALRERRGIAAVRVPLPRRQLGHGGLRVPLRAPDRGPGVAARRAGRR